MKNWKRLVAVPVLVATVAFGVLAPSAASAETDRVTDRPSDRVTDLRPTDVRSDLAEAGRVELREPHTLEARGRGNVALAGRLKMTGIAYGHSVTIVDHAGDAQIRVSARADVRNDDGSITFRGLNGEFAISGSEVVVKFHRVGIHFEATGNGRAELDGYGWFKLDDGRPHRWRAF